MKLRYMLVLDSADVCVCVSFNKLLTILGIYEMFCNHKNFYIGKQPEPFPGTDTVRLLMLHIAVSLL